MKQFYWMSASWCWFCFFWIGAILPAWATHIVGGELELKRLTNQNYTHQVNLNLYFDELNGNPQAEDPSVNVFVFRKGDNAYMGYIVLPQVGSQRVDYTRPECAVSSLRTRLLQYSTLVNFNLGAFNDARGYYMIWERCCRNNSISNIQNPQGAGSTFYLEFPAQQTANGANFINSSPAFNVAKGDYICINQPFSFDFGATDADGDSLVYSLVTPYNGYSTASTPIPATPTPSSAYPEVRWVSGLNKDRAIPGPDPLKVNARTGQLTVTAGQVGLFVFCVLVEEYRNKQRIGLVRRDYQLKVIDCQLNRPPSVLMRPNGQTTFYQEGTLLTLSAAGPNCLTLFVTDKDPNSRVKMSVVEGPSTGIRFTPDEVLIRTPGDTVRTQVCFDSCFADNKPIKLALVATDEGCPQGQKDTLVMALQIEPAPNQKPRVATTLPGNQTTVQAGQSLLFQVLGTDVDQDMITLEAVGRGFTLAQAGMSFSSASGQGSVKQPFQWAPTCDQIKNTEYVVDFVVTDKHCNRLQRDTVTVRLKALPATGQSPTIRTTLARPVVELTLMSGDTGTSAVRFNVIGEDPDPGNLTLTATGQGYDWKAVGMQFAAKTGPSPLVAPFSWQPTCAVLQGKDSTTLYLDFRVQDTGCPVTSDTTRVTFIVKDLPANYNITIPNVFTPNGDGRNDYFTVPDLPQDNCRDQFRRVEITNRWGKAVYKSTSRNFQWDGDNLPPGQYLYLIQFANRFYKGVVTLLR